MKVLLKVGDIVDEEVDGLISSGNVYLNMSGGVSGEIMRRGGKKVQEELHGYLKKRNINFVEPGTVVQVSAGPAKAKALFYAVAVNVWYDSNIQLVSKIIIKALTMANSLSAATITLPALATGYGRLTMEDFAKSLKMALRTYFPAIEEIRVVLSDEKSLTIVHEELSSIWDYDGSFEYDGKYFLIDRATRNSQSILLPMPASREKLQLQRTFSPEEYHQMSYGHIPQSMDEKWFIFLEGDWLYIHRGWTGICVYQVRLENESGNYQIAEAWVNRDPEQYGSKNNEHDTQFLQWIIEYFLLGAKRDPVMGEEISSDSE
jgi:O-acetyl-ADP-ribose deacetylase